jgi:outer membrane protein insertion porin family
LLSRSKPHFLAHGRAHGVLRITAAMLALCVGGAVSLGQPVSPDDREAKDPSAPRQGPPTSAPGTAAAMEGVEQRPVRTVTLKGLTKTPEGLVLNQIRTKAGQPLSTETVRGDVARLNRLAKFKEVSAKAVPLDDGSIEVVFQFVETSVVRAVDIVGNRQIPNSEISPLVNGMRDTPVDEFQLGAAKAQIEKLYHDKGYFQATVTVDQKELEQGTVLFRVAEGERVRVTEIRFEGNNAFKAKQLTPRIKTTEAGIFDSGPVDNEQLDRDVQSLIEFYHDRGYLDVRADRRVIFSPNGKEAIVEFVVEEGPLYTLRSVRAELAGEGEGGIRSGKSPVVLSEAQIRGIMEIKAGDVYSVDKVRKSTDAVKNAYASMGYVDAQVRGFELRDPGSPVVDLLLVVAEGERFRTGTVTVKGDSITQQKVIIREITDIKPDRPLNMATERVGDKQVTDAEQRINDLNLFEPGSVKLTTQPEDPANPGYRDVLVEVRETNTGSLSFGLGAGSDSGLIGIIGLKQRNFDVADVPDSVSEFFSGRAFRGAGQTFDISLQPGTEVQTYSISLSDPYLFDTDYSGGINGFYFKRQYDEYDERRLGAHLQFGRRFGERWVGNLTLRYDDVKISNIANDGPQDLFDVEGANAVTGVGFKLSRSTTDSRLRPTKGSRMSGEIERVGVFGGDYDFTRITLDHTVYIPLHESFLGYRTVFSWRTQASYIPEGSSKAPIFERLYLGGRSFRGFRFRTVSPKGYRHDMPGVLGNDGIGGSWLFFTGVEVQQPIYQDVVSAVGFVDTGTVTNHFGLAEYRVSVGAGVRIAVPQLGPVPLAFDFGFPILKEDGDRKRIFSFTLDVPF